MKRIMIVGVGGIGGLIGAKLMQNTDAAVTLIARGAHLQAIIENGLTFYDNEEKAVLRPALATDDPAKAGVQDVIFLATKSYGLSAAVRSIAPAVGEHTYVIPLLNGVDTSKRIMPLLDKGIVCDGLIYVFSRITAPGVIKKEGAMLKAIIGRPDDSADAGLEEIAALLRQAQVPAEVPKSIRYEMWNKWSMMLCSAQTAAYYDKTIGQMREDEEARAFFMGVARELLQVAEAERVPLPSDQGERLMAKIMDMPYDSTPSLIRDLHEPGKPTELSVLGGELHALGLMHGIPTPLNDRVLEKYGDRI